MYEAPHYAVFSSLPFISSLLGPNILLRTLFANTRSPYSSVIVRDPFHTRPKLQERGGFSYFIIISF
jgi:hypothetical protein